MAKRLQINFHESRQVSQTVSRWIILVSQGDWCQPLLNYRAEPNSAFTLGDFIAHCSHTDREDLLERMHAKVVRGLPVWFNDEPIAAAEVRRLLDAHDVERD